MRVAVIGDDGVGKSTLIASLFKNRYVENIEDVIPPLIFPRNNANPVTVIDTSPSPELRAQLLSELRQASCLWLVYSDKYTLERISLFWLPLLRSCGINLPIVLCQNKQDNLQDFETFVDNESDDIMELMYEYKEIDSYIKTSARNLLNIDEAFYLCHRAVTFPLAPLFDTKAGQLKPEPCKALNRIYFLLDPGNLGLSYSEFADLQKHVFKTHFPEQDFNLILQTLNTYGLNLSDKLSKDGFLKLAEIYCARGRHETVWEILRAFHYTNSLSLTSEFLNPVFSIGRRCHVELSPTGYEFLVDLFTLCDKDNDGGLNYHELQTVFSATPGVPSSWHNFPYTTLRNDREDPTLQGWLAQWSMFVYLSPHNALSYLSMMGYTLKNKDIKTAVKLTKPSKPRSLRSKLYRSSVIRDRQVFNCYIFGSSKSGKSSIISSFVNSSVLETSSIAVNTVELPGGKQCYLILQEPDPSILDDESKMDECDVVCLAYDSSDPHSFAVLIELLQKYPKLSLMPLVFAALKADLDKVQQHSESPDVFIQKLGLSPPIHVSSVWPSSLNALYVQITEVAINPGLGTITDPEEIEYTKTFPIWEIGAATAFVAALALVYRRLKQ